MWPEIDKVFSKTKCIQHFSELPHTACWFLVKCQINQIFLVKLDFRHTVDCSSSKKSTELTKDAPIKELVNSDSKKYWIYGITQLSALLRPIMSKNPGSF